MKSKILWLQVVLQVLRLIEMLIPAYLIAENGRLKSQKAGLEKQLETAKLRVTISEEKAKVRAANEGKSSRNIIDDFLGKSGQR